MKIYILFFFTVLILQACTSMKDSNQEPLARVYNNYLYRDDLRGIFPKGINTSDSVKIARNYIEKWIRNQLFLRLAEINLPEEDKNLDKQISDFRASLLIFKYKQYLISQKLDSLISIKELEDYYKNHGSNFILDKPAIRGIYLKVPVDAPNHNRLLTWFRNDNDIFQIENYSNQYAVTYIRFNDHWIYLEDIIRELPPGSYKIPDNPVNFDHISVSDKEYQHFLGILEFNPPRSQMPLSLASEKIKNIILNKRKIQFLDELEKRVFTEGLSKNSFQYYF